jgi:hypothetical protein
MVRWVLALLAALPLLCILWGGVTHALILRGDEGSVHGTSWTLLRTFGAKDDPGESTSTLSISASPGLVP